MALLEWVIKNLNRIKNPKEVEFLRNFNFWNKFWRLENKQQDLSTKILVENLKYIILVGLVDSFEKEGSARKKFKKFFIDLNIEEKLYFLLNVFIENVLKETEEILNKFFKSPFDESILQKYQDHWAEIRKKRNQYFQEILQNYQNSNKEFLDNKIEESLGFIYDNIRSETCHSGKPTLFAAHFFYPQNYFIFHSAKKNKILYLRIDENFKIEGFFLRAFCRKFNLEPPSINSALKNLLKRKFYLDFGLIVSKIIPSLR